MGQIYLISVRKERYSKGGRKYISTSRTILEENVYKTKASAMNSVRYVRYKQHRFQPHVIRVKY